MAEPTADLDDLTAGGEAGPEGDAVDPNT